MAVARIATVVAGRFIENDRIRRTVRLDRSRRPFDPRAYRISAIAKTCVLAMISLYRKRMLIAKDGRGAAGSLESPKLNVQARLRPR